MTKKLVKLVKRKHNNGRGLVWHIKTASGREINTHYNANPKDGFSRKDVEEIYKDKIKMLEYIEKVKR